MDLRKELTKFANDQLEVEKKRIADEIRDAADRVLADAKPGVRNVGSAKSKRRTTKKSNGNGSNGDANQATTGNGSNGSDSNDKDDEDGELVTRAEAARRLGMSYTVMTRLTRQGKVPTVGSGRRQKVRISEARKALAA